MTDKEYIKKLETRLERAELLLRKVRLMDPKFNMAIQKVGREFKKLDKEIDTYWSQDDI